MGCPLQLVGWEAACIQLFSLGHADNGALRMPSRPLTLRPAVYDDLPQGTVISESLATGEVAGPSEGSLEPATFPAFPSSKDSQCMRVYVIILPGFMDCDHGSS